MGEFKKYWAAVVAVLVIGFSILGYLGTDVYHQAPPIPEAYVSQDGQVLFTKDDILHGQSAWQSTGGQSVGTVLGHGAYQAPDWTADWLHKEVSIMLDIKAQEAFGMTYDQLAPSSIRVTRILLPLLSSLLLWWVFSTVRVYFMENIAIWPSWNTGVGG